MSSSVLLKQSWEPLEDLMGLIAVYEASAGIPKYLHR